MVFVKLIRENGHQITCEVLNLNHGTWMGDGIDRILLSRRGDNDTHGLRVTAEDFELLLEVKEAENKRILEESRTAEEARLAKEREEIRRWKEEKQKIESKFFYKVY